MIYKTKEQMDMDVVEAQRNGPESIQYQEIWAELATAYKKYIYKIIGNSRHKDDIYQEICLDIPRMIDKYEHKGHFHSFICSNIHFTVLKFENGIFDTIKNNKEYSTRTGKIKITTTNLDDAMIKYNNDFDNHIFLDECWDLVKQVKHADVWWEAKVFGNSTEEIMEERGLKNTEVYQRIKTSGNHIIPILKDSFEWNIPSEKATETKPKQEVHTWQR